MRLDKYLDNVREIERRIQAIEARNTSGEARELPDAPAGVPDSFTEHMRLMFDLQVLALETDMTRIITFKTGRDSQNRVFPESESNQPFHPASHHGNREDRILEFNKICKFRVGQLPYFLEKLKSSMDGDQNLLEKTVVMWGSPMADANVHNHRRCPLVLLGHGNGMLEGNLHLKAADATPMANVMLTLLQAPRPRGPVRASATAPASSRCGSRRSPSKPAAVQGDAGHAHFGLSLPDRASGLV